MLTSLFLGGKPQVNAQAATTQCVAPGRAQATTTQCVAPGRHSTSPPSSNQSTQVFHFS
jgi:hypothetical protein